MKNVSGFASRSISGFIAVLLAVQPAGFAFAADPTPSPEAKEAARAAEEIDGFLADNPAFKYLDADGNAITRKDLQGPHAKTAFYIVPPADATTVPTAIGVKYVAGKEKVNVSFASFDISQGFAKKKSLGGKSKAEFGAKSDLKDVVIDLERAMSGLSHAVAKADVGTEKDRKVASSGTCVENMITYITLGTFVVALLSTVAWSIAVESKARNTGDGGWSLLGVYGVAVMGGVVTVAVVGISQAIRVIRGCHNSKAK